MNQSNHDASFSDLTGLIQAESAAISRFLAAPHRLFAESMTAIAASRCDTDRAVRVDTTSPSFFSLAGANAHDTTAEPRSR